MKSNKKALTVLFATRKKKVNKKIKTNSENAG